MTTSGRACRQGDELSGRSFSPVLDESDRKVAESRSKRLKVVTLMATSIQAKQVLFGGVIAM